jgi:WD40 repeat protein
MPAFYLPGGAVAAAVLPGGGRLAVIASDGSLRFWDLGSGGLSAPRRLVPDPGSGVCGAFSASGDLAATCGGSLRLWRISADHPVQVGEAAIQAGAIVVSPDGRRLVTRNGPEGMQLLDRVGGTPAVHLRRSGETVADVAFSPDGNRLAVANNPGSLEILDWATGAVLASFRPGYKSAVAWGPGGRIVVATITGRVVDYRCAVCASERELVDRARRTVTRELTPAELARFEAG